MYSAKVVKEGEAYVMSLKIDQFAEGVYLGIASKNTEGKLSYKCLDLATSYILSTIGTSEQEYNFDYVGDGDTI